MYFGCSACYTLYIQVIIKQINEGGRTMTQGNGQRRFSISGTKIIACTAIGAFLLGILITGIVFGLTNYSRKIVIEPKVLEQNIRTIAEYATISHKYTDVAVFSEQTTVKLFNYEFAIPGTAKSFIILYDGEIKIGIDASQIEIDITRNEINIFLPSAYILSHVIKEDSVKVLDERSGLFNALGIMDYTTFVTEQKQEMEKRADLYGLYEQAQKNAELQIETLILSLPGIAGEYTICFR
jgi:hypothetical protein